VKTAMREREKREAAHSFNWTEKASHLLDEKE